MAPRLMLLGRVMIGHGDTMIQLRGAKPRAFLATLLLNANRAVSRDRLVETMWDGEPPLSAMANIRNYASQLRQAAVRALPSGSERLITERAQYIFRVEPGELDMDVFRGLASQGHAALRAGQVSRAVELCTSALAHWRGRAGEDLPRAGGLGRQLAALDELRLSTAEDQLEARLVLGDLPAVTAALRSILTEHPCRERAWSLLMLALYRAGDVAGALDGYLDARTAMVSRLGVEPGPELQRLHHAILTREPTLDGGEQHLRYLDASVAQVSTGGPSDRTDAVTAPDAPESPGHLHHRTSAAPAGPPVETAAFRSGPPCQLPRGTAVFVGRSAEMAVLNTALTSTPDNGPGPVVAVSGPGGVGKSALAVRAARMVAGHYPDGQLYLDLDAGGRGPLDARGALVRLLRALGAPDEFGEATSDEAAAHFRSMTAQRRLLLLLDNARDPAQVHPLLPSGAGCGAIVTSRQRMAMLGDVTFLDLPGLLEPEAIEMLHRLIGHRRAAAEPEAARAIVRLCDRLPLAIGIVGARLNCRPGWSLEAIRARLAEEGRRLNELEYAAQSLRSCLSTGYRMLLDSPDALDRLAARVVRLIGRRRRAHGQVSDLTPLLGGDPTTTERALERAVDVRLLDCPAPGRYRVSDLVRLFAAELGPE